MLVATSGTTKGSLTQTPLRTPSQTPKHIPIFTNSFPSPVKNLPSKLPCRTTNFSLSKQIAYSDFTDTFRSHYNLTTEERRTISALGSHPIILIHPAIKGYTRSVMNYSDNRSEALKEFSDPLFYDPLEDNPTQSFLTKIRTYPQALPRDTI